MWQRAGVGVTLLLLLLLLVSAEHVRAYPGDEQEADEPVDVEREEETAEQSDDPLNCPSFALLSAYNGTLATNENSATYPLDVTCQWLIEPSPPMHANQYLSLKFTQFKTIASSGILTVYNGNSTNAHVLLRTSGSKLPHTLAGLNHSLLIVFSSLKATQSASGIEMEYVVKSRCSNGQLTCAPPGDTKKNTARDTSRHHDTPVTRKPVKRSDDNEHVRPPPAMPNIQPVVSVPQAAAADSAPHSSPLVPDADAHTEHAAAATNTDNHAAPAAAAAPSQQSTPTTTITTPTTRAVAAGSSSWSVFAAFTSLPLPARIALCATALVLILSAIVGLGIYMYRRSQPLPSYRSYPLSIIATANECGAYEPVRLISDVSSSSYPSLAPAF